MLSLRSREDARKRVGFGPEYGGRGRMVGNEVEDGEARASQEDETTIDPDISLSYIDEKIQDILGHFQKDFEGGLSAENLGSKFGGYGSFLPTYPRSPSIRSHSKSPGRVPNHNNPISPDTPLAEGANHKLAVPVSASVSMKNNSVAAAPQLDDTKRNETSISSPYFGEFTLQHDMINKLSKHNDQKIPKVRIKVRPENILCRPNAAIYSDMGLDYSPSSSLEDSPSAREGFSLETRDSHGESPMSVLKIMTCFPIAGGYVLSPLSERVLHLMENGRPFLRDCKLGTFTIGVETQDVMKSEMLPTSNGKVLLGRKVKNIGKNMRSLEIENLKCNADTKNGTDVKMPVAKMPVFDALNTPIRSSSRDAGEKTESQQLEVELKGSGVSQEPDKVLGKDREPSCDLSEEELLNGMPSLHAGMFDTVGNDYPHLKGKLEFESCSSDRVLEEGKPNNHRGAQLDLHNKVRGGAERGRDAFNSAVGTSKVRKDIIVESAEHIKMKAPQKSTLNEGEGEKMLQARGHSSGMKRKTKGSDGMSCADNSKENIRVACSLSSKEKKKSSHSNRDHSEDKQNVLKSHESSRILNKEFHSVGEAKDETSDYGSDLSKNIFRDKTKDSMLGNEKDAFAFVEKAKEKLSVKNVEKPQMSETLRKGLYPSPSIADGSTSDAAPVTSSHVVIRENWVCCDKCHTWRLLPYWTDPGQLPNKWLCTMLNWLPGMNKCSFSEEETTSALHAVYQASLPENQTSVNGPNSEIAAGAVSTSVQNVVQNHISSLHMASSYDKKKNTPKDVPCQGMQFCQSDKKNQHVSMKSRGSCQNQVETNVSSKSSFQPVNKSTELNLEKVDERQKKKHKMVGRYSTGGEFIDQKDQLSKSKNKRGSDQDGFRASKKGKAEVACNADKDWHSDHNLTKSLSFLNGGSPSKVTAKSVLGYADYSSSKDSKCNSKDSLSGSRSKSKASIKVSLNGICKGHFSTSNVEMYDKNNSSANKRKVKQQQECQFPPVSMVGSGILVDDRANIKEGISENKSRKAKKGRISRTEERETFTTMMDGKIDKKGQVVRVLLSSRKECPLDGTTSGKKGLENEQRAQYLESVESEPNTDCSGSKRDLSFVQTSTTATSSSSKVSGFSKNKCNFTEVRGSPVESVSSSPLRISNVEKFGSEKNTVGRDDPVQASLSMLRSSRRSSDGEVGQIDQSATIRRDKPSSVVYNQSLEGYPDVDFEVTEPANGAADYLDREASSLSVDKAKNGMHLKSSRNFNVDSLAPEFEENNLVASDNIQGKNCRHDPEKRKSHYYSTSCDQQKSCKNSLLQTKDKHRSSKSNVGKHKVSDVDKHKVRASDCSSEKEDACPFKNGDRFRNDADADPLNPCCLEDLGNEKCKGVEKDKKKEAMGKCSSECRRGDNFNFAATDNLEDNILLAKQHRDLNSRVSETGRDSTKKIKSLHDNSQKTTCYEDERLSNCLNPDQTQKLELTEKGKSQHLPHSGDKLPSSQEPQTVIPSAKLGRSEMSSVDVMIGDASKVLEHPKLDCQNGTHHSNLVHLIGNGFDARSPPRQDRNHPAANVVLKEARQLKHTANRLKSEGLEYESTSLYFEAALKFLHVASILESSSAESGKRVESTQSMIMYSETAKLCQFCAHEYEKWQEMAAIALAYKCVEVAYMKAVFLKHSLASKDRHELLIALQMVPLGESPSSSASDIDNVNNQIMVDKAGSVKAVNSPQTAGAHVITARNYQILERLLNFTEDVVHAMDAIKKSHAAFRAANDPKKSSCGPEGIASVRKVLNLSFNDVEGLLHLVRLSINSISH